MAYTGTTAAILSNYSEVLKTFYLPAIQEQLNNGTVLASMLETNETDVAGKNATINLHYGRNSGTGARKDGGALPDAGYQKHQTCTVPMKYQYGRVTFSGPTIAATRDQKGSYANVVDNEIQGITRDLMMEVNRQFWGCGYGILARWRTGTSTSITLQRSYRGNSAGGDGFGSTFGAKYLKPNGNSSGCIQIVTEASAVITATTLGTTDIAVSAVTETPLLGYDTITCTDTSTTEAVGAYYVRPASAISLATSTAAGAGRLEMMGLRGIVTDSNLDDIAIFSGTSTSNTAPIDDGLQGLVVGTYTWWKAIVDSHSAGRYGGQRALTFKLMDKMFDKVEENAGKDYGPDVVITTRAIRREYKELCDSDRRMVNTMTLDGGWKALEYNGIPLMVDDDAIDGEMYFLTMRDLQIYRMSDYNWMDKDGSILSRISGYDAYEAVLYRYAELGCKRRNSQGVLCDLAYDVA